MVIIGTYREISPQESLKEAALSTAAVPEHIAAEHAALRLLLLQVDLLVSGHCSVDTKIHQVLLLLRITHGCSRSTKLVNKKEPASFNKLHSWGSTTHQWFLPPGTPAQQLLRIQDNPNTPGIAAHPDMWSTFRKKPRSRTRQTATLSNWTFFAYISTAMWLKFGYKKLY